jgi:hypothetical protein
MHGDAVEDPLRDLTKRVIQALEAQIVERQDLIAELRGSASQPTAAVPHVSKTERPQWSAARRRRFNATWAKKKLAKAKGA